MLRVIDQSAQGCMRPQVAIRDSGLAHSRSGSVGKKGVPTIDVAQPPQVDSPIQTRSNLQTPFQTARPPCVYFAYGRLGRYRIPQRPRLVLTGT